MYLPWEHFFEKITEQKTKKPNEHSHKLQQEKVIIKKIRIKKK